MTAHELLDMASNGCVIVEDGGIKFVYTPDTFINLGLLPLKVTDVAQVTVVQQDVSII